MAERENYYLVLDLDPTISDQASIEARIREKQLEWSNAASTGVGAKARKANVYKAMLNDIRRVMLDPAARAAEAAAARKLSRDTQAAADADLDRHIAAICANGQFSTDQLKRLQNQFRASHDPAEVERRLAKRCPRKDPARAAGSERLETIDRTDITKHDQNLGVVGQRDLYAFLGAGPKTPAASLHAEADRRNREIITRNQNTPEATAAKELCGLAMKLFASDAGKQRYDNTLSLAVMEAMRSVIQASVSNGRITRAVLDRLVRDGAKQGMDRTRAQGFIVDLATAQGWFVDDEPLPVSDYPQCSICGAIADSKDQTNCGNCGHPFQIPCGNCGRQVPVANSHCPHCGSSLADAALMLDLLRQAEDTMAAGDWPAVAGLLARLNGKWPGWPPVQARGRIAYHVVAGSDRPPRDDTDGKLLAETAETTFLDTDAPVGRPWHYAIFTRRAGVASARPARSGPHLRTAEVSDLTAEPGAGSVTLNWKPPERFAGIVVRRQESSVPRSNLDGVAVVCGERSMQDNGLEDGRTYGYRIAVQFADPSQPTCRITTTGIGITARPQQPPPAVEDLAWRRDGNGFTLTWTTPTQVQVQLRRGPYPTPFEPMQVISLAQADRLGKAIAVHRPGQTHVQLPGSGSYQITPLSVRGELAVVGQGVRITNIDEVSDPRCRVAGCSILLTWGWPPGVDTVRVVNRTDRPPQTPDELGAIAVDVPRIRYERQDGWMLLADAAKPHYFRLFAKAPNADAWSSGTAVQALFGQGPMVQSQVRIRRNWLRQVLAAELVLSSHNVVEIEDVAIIVAADHLPLDPNSGELAGRFARVTLVDGVATLPIPEKYWGRNRYARAFCMDAGQGVQLRPGGKSQMRLG
jgi:hypothetical protein